MSDPQPLSDEEIAAIRERAAEMRKLWGGAVMRDSLLGDIESLLALVEAQAEKIAELTKALGAVDWRLGLRAELEKQKRDWMLVAASLVMEAGGRVAIAPGNPPGDERLELVVYDEPETGARVFEVARAGQER